MSVLTHCRRALKDDGELVLTLPHPSLPWLRAAEAPFYFERPSLPYRGPETCDSKAESGSVPDSPYP